MAKIVPGRVRNEGIELLKKDPLPFIRSQKLSWIQQLTNII